MNINFLLTIRLKKIDSNNSEEENKLLVEENPKDEKITGEREPREKPKNWYFDQYPKRYAAIKQAGEQRNDDKKKFLQSAEKYDALKRSFYNITTAAVDEGVINEDGNISLFLEFTKIIFLKID